VIPEDLNLHPKYEGLPYTLIMDGHVIHKNLAKKNLNIEWLYQELEYLGIASPKDVLFACLDTEDKLFCQLKSGKEAK